MIKREKTRKNPKKMAGGSEALGRGVGGVDLAMPATECLRNRLYR